jgi:hypothetical protein
MKRYLPVFTLALLSPFVAEILLGATPVSRIASLPPLILLYGGGTVLIRELARRISPGWNQIALLAAAYALVEEGLVMQTMFSPDLFNAAASGGRALGVNWVWTEVLVGYHVVWSIVIPIALVELCFPERRAQPWLGRIGTMIALVSYALGAVAIAVVFRRFLTPHFRASATLLIATGIATACLIAWALRVPKNPQPKAWREASGNAPSPWLVGLAALIATGLWFQLFTLPQPLRSGLWVFFPMILEGCLAWGFVALLQRWSASARHWTDLHSLALVVGALLASMIYGVTVIKTGAPFDRGAQAFCSVFTVVLLGTLAHHVHSGLRETAPLTEAAGPREHS